MKGHIQQPGAKGDTNRVHEREKAQLFYEQLLKFPEKTRHTITNALIAEKSLDDPEHQDIQAQWNTLSKGAQIQFFLLSLEEGKRREQMEDLTYQILEIPSGIRGEVIIALRGGKPVDDKYKELHEKFNALFAGNQGAEETAEQVGRKVVEKMIFLMKLGKMIQAEEKLSQAPKQFGVFD